MRHVVYLLLAANLVYLGWNLFQSQAHSRLARELPPLPATAKPLVTLQELKQQEEQRRAGQESAVQGTRAGQQVNGVAAVEALTQAQPPGAGVSMLCQTLGPFLAAQQLEEVAARLDGMGLETRRRRTEERLENGWWVYLPAMPRAEARKIVRMLVDKNDREYYVGKDNFISLGTFRVLPRAERRMKRARKLGLDPLLEARYKTQVSHWLDLPVTSGFDGDLAWLAEDYPDLQLEPQVCR